MFQRESKSEPYRRLVEATRKAPIRFECIPPTAKTMMRTRVYIYRAAASLGVKVKVLTIDEHGSPLPPGVFNVTRPGWTMEQDDET